MESSETVKGSGRETEEMLKKPRVKFQFINESQWSEVSDLVRRQEQSEMCSLCSGRREDEDTELTSLLVLVSVTSDFKSQDLHIPVSFIVLVLCSTQGQLIQDKQKTKEVPHMSVKVLTGRQCLVLKQFLNCIELWINPKWLKNQPHFKSPFFQIRT